MNNGAVAEIATIERMGELKATRVSGKRKYNSNAFERGEHIPDEVNLKTCLNCTRAKCPGRCNLVRGTKKT